MSKKGRRSGDDPRTKTLSMRLTEDEHIELEEYAKAHDMSKTQVLIEAFRMMKNQKNRG